MNMNRNLLTAIASLALVAGCYTLPAQPDGRKPDLGNDPMNGSEDPNYDPSIDPDPDPNQDPMEDPMMDPMMDPPPIEDPTEDPTPMPGNPLLDAEVLFNDTVRPIMQAKCSATVCHGGTDVSPLKFCPDVPAQYHVVITGYATQLTGYFDKAVAPIIHKVYPGPHPGVMYDAADIAKIEAWLDAEKAARQDPNNPNPNPNPTGPSPGEISEQLMTEWSGCMNLAEWNQLEVAQAWAAKGSGEGPCIRCHINGQASFIATDESERMFNVLTTSRFFMSTFFVANVVDLANAKMEVNRPEFERVGNNLYPHIEHPSFNVDGNAMTKLVDFYNLTMARKAAGTCDPPRLPPL
jgi:hypothetical protein